MAVPKKKTSKRRSANRKATNTKLSPIAVAKCSKCGELIKPHTACSYCGHYRGIKVLDVKSTLDKKLKKEKKGENSEQA